MNKMTAITHEVAEQWLVEHHQLGKTKESYTATHTRVLREFHAPLNSLTFVGEFSRGEDSHVYRFDDMDGRRIETTILFNPRTHEILGIGEVTRPRP